MPISLQKVKVIKILEMKEKTIKHLEKNIGVCFYDHGGRKRFLKQTQIKQDTKMQTVKGGFNLTILKLLYFIKRHW